MKPHLVLFVACLPLVALAGASCGEVSRTVDCAGVCNRYADCFDSSYDVSACVDRCEGESDRDDEFEQRVDVCLACADDQACSETFDCIDECAGIVP